MRRHPSGASPAELLQLMELTQRVGKDPLLTQASTGNSSAKLEDTLWIKASGRWMADAIQHDIFVPLNLAEVSACVRRNIDPAGRYPNASLETALHAILPHRMVLHVHCVNTIAWAVRRDAPAQLQHLLAGMRWRWIPYAASGLPLSAAIEDALSVQPDSDLFVLGNHGLVVCADNPVALEELLTEVGRRLAVHPRAPCSADYAGLSELSRNSCWDLPDDDQVHALGTDPNSDAILREGLLYPCQAIFSGSSRPPEVFHPIPYPDPAGKWQLRYSDQAFLIIEGRGVIVRRNIAAAQRAMISGLAHVVRRLSASAPLRYLTEAEVAEIPAGSHRYRDLAETRTAAGLQTS